MRIYACVPEEIFSDNTRRERLCSDLHRAFEGYYGKFAPSDIQFFRSDNSTVNLYVMEKSLKPEYDDKIIASARNIFACPVEVRLNYQTLNPAFKPQDAASSQRASLKGNEFDYEKLSFNYDAEEPLYTFDQVILPASTRMRINEAVAVMSHEVKQKVFEDWGLKNIVPNPASAINFYGSPGTGKTMAAEAIAKMLGKKIIRASYADIESKYHGEGPKMIKAIFLAAKREDAVLFIDEADSLLSKRMTDVTDGSAQAVNSMRSQLLISLEHFDGVVIFATNLIVNYDKAFISRLVCIEIPDPDSEGRKRIWEQHIRGKGISIPLHDDVNTKELAEKYSENFYGREIRKSVILACVTCAANNREILLQSDFLEAAEKVKTEAERVAFASDHTQSTLKGLLQKKLDEHNAKKETEPEKLESKEN